MLYADIFATISPDTTIIFFAIAIALPFSFQHY
jgi:hypothetical protein